jgi:hypothetical protein
VLPVSRKRADLAQAALLAHPQTKRQGRHTQPIAMPERRFPPPWSVEETDACFIVRDHARNLIYIKVEHGSRAYT